MALQVKTEDVIQPTSNVTTTTTAAEGSSSSISYESVLALLSQFPEVNPTAQAATTGSELEKTMQFLLSCIQQLQVALGMLNRSKDGFLSEQAKLNIKSAEAAAREAEAKWADYHKQQDEAAKAQEAMKIFGFVVMALSCVVAALTGGACAFLIAVTMTVLFASGAMEKMKEGLKEAGLSGPAADAVIFAVVIAVSLCGNFGSALGKIGSQAATLAAEEGSELAASQVTSYIKDVVLQQLKSGELLKKVLTTNLVSNLSQGLMTSGLINDLAVAVVDAIPDDPSLSKEENQKRKLIVKAVLVFLLSLVAMMGAMTANGAASSDGLLNQLFSKMGLQGSRMTALWNMARGLDATAQLGQAACGIGSGAIEVQASHTLDEMGGLQGKGLLEFALAQILQKNMDDGHETFLTDMKSIDGMIKKLLDSFGMTNSEARALL